jgi:histidinol-phosphate phosphatase family protein
MTGPRRALFIDRDGTLIVDVGYPRDPAQVEPLPGALDALRALQAHHALVIVSNQSGIGRGLITPAEAGAVHARVVERFGQAGVAFAGAYYCPHDPGAGCACRKPAPVSCSTPPASSASISPRRSWSATSRPTSPPAAPRAAATRCGSARVMTTTATMPRAAPTGPRSWRSSAHSCRGPAAARFVATPSKPG